VAEFLRARREHLQPADVGLPDRGRRRTPGLRREEVATLAGVSIDYLVRLEQGRDTRPSPSVIAALANALQLDDDERRQFTILAMVGQSSELCPGPRPLTREVPPTVIALVEQLSPTPAFVVGPSNDVLAWNDAWEDLVRPLGMLEGAVPNLARHMFLHPGGRTAYPDWEAAADEQVSRLRSATERWGDDPSFTSLLDELRTAPDFIDVLAVAVGPAITVALSRARRDRFFLLAGAALGTLLIINLSGLSEGEVERIWLPFVPWVATAAAAPLVSDQKGWLALHVTTGLLIQVLLRSPW
jgi:transcriptional regulator with XRE-family HTH domain